MMLDELIFYALAASSPVALGFFAWLGVRILRARAEVPASVVRSSRKPEPVAHDVAGSSGLASGSSSQSSPPTSSSWERLKASAAERTPSAYTVDDQDDELRETTHFAVTCKSCGWKTRASGPDEGARWPRCPRCRTYTLVGRAVYRVLEPIRRSA